MDKKTETIIGVAIGIIVVAIVLFLALAVKECQAEWSKEDTQRETIYLVLHGADWLQTREISRNPYYTEMNPILGQNPTLQQVDSYFLISGIGHYLISRQLSPKWRERWQMFSIGFEASTVAWNLRIGIAIKL